MSRPTVREIYAFRVHVDEYMLGLPINGDLAPSGQAAPLLGSASIMSNSPKN